MYESIMINGEIYIKRGPEIFHIPDSIKDNKNYLEGDSLSDNPKLPPWFNKLAMNIINNMESHEGKKDYNGCSEFWTSIVSDNGIYMMEQSENKLFVTIFNYKSRKDLNKDFIRLSEFLGKAMYVGRYLKRTSQLDSNEVLMNEDNTVFVLYELNDLMLVNNRIDGYQRYKILPALFTEDGNYTYYGPYTSEFDNREEISGEIYRQVLRYNKGKR